MLRYCLDVMHIEKNVCDNVLFISLNESDKSKDHLQSWKDLKEMGIQPKLQLDDNGKFHPIKFTLSKSNKDVFLKTLKNINIPNGYSSNISRCINLRQ